MANPPKDGDAKLKCLNFCPVLFRGCKGMIDWLH